MSFKYLCKNPGLYIVVTIAEHASDDAPKRILKLSTHRLQIIFVKYEYLRSIQLREDQGIREKLKKRVYNHVLAILTTHMETRLKALNEWSFNKYCLCLTKIVLNLNSQRNTKINFESPLTYNVQILGSNTMTIADYKDVKFVVFTSCCQVMDKRNRPSYSLKSIHSNVSTAKDHGENYMKVRPPLVRHLFHV